MKDDRVMQNKILLEQLAYYRARAKEYDESLKLDDSEANQELEQIIKALHALAPVVDVLELACGTGIWTRELLHISRSLTALDGSPEMLQLNQARLRQASIEYQCADLFSWGADRQYDLVFFAFWLSHVPPTHLRTFFGKVARATRIGGRVFIIDEPKEGRHLSGANEEGMYQRRTLRDGSTFQIVKVYYSPQEIRKALQTCGFQAHTSITGDDFFHLCATRVE
jgi:ubiquinone/menaquinone biosynthesis C-methylase UbiE